MKNATVGVLGVAFATAVGFGIWRDHKVRQQFQQAAIYADSVIAARSDTISKLKIQRDSLLIVAAASRTIYITQWKTKWDTVRVGIDKPDLTLPEAILMLHTADSTITSCSLALVDCVKAQEASLTQSRQDSLMRQDLERRLKLEQARPTGSSMGTKLLYAMGGVATMATVCVLAH